MTVNLNTDQQEVPKVSDKELNFRALQAKYEKELQQERNEKQQILKELHEKSKQQQAPVTYANDEEDDENDGEPYIDKKKLNKTLARFGEKSQKATQSEIQKAVQMAREEERRESWLENNSDFYDTLQNHAEKLALRSPALAKSILSMPDTFERQKLVYQSIKELGLDKPEQKQSTIQEKVDANKRNPYYQPSGVGTAPYASVGDFSKTGQKSAYDKMQQLKANLRI